MNVVVFETPGEKSRGLIGVSPIPEDTLFVFPGTRAGGWFHSRGVLHPFEIAFLDERNRPLSIHRVVPPDGVVAAPPGTSKAVEAADGTFSRFRGSSGLGHVPPGYDIPNVVSGFIIALGLGIGYWGYRRQKDPIGAIALSAGGSLVASGVLIIFLKQNSF